MLIRNFKGHSFGAGGYYINTVGLDEAKVRKYIRDQEINESVDDRWDSNPDSNPFYRVNEIKRVNPLRGAINNAFLGLIKPPAMPVVLT